MKNLWSMLLALVFPVCLWGTPVALPDSSFESTPPPFALQLRGEATGTAQAAPVQLRFLVVGAPATLLLDDYELTDPSVWTMTRHGKAEGTTKVVDGGRNGARRFWV